MRYPTGTMILEADIVQLAKWFRFLPTPSCMVEQALSDEVFRRLHNMGGITPEISKQIGWEEYER